jgi:hypothetical protein
MTELGDTIQTSDGKILKLVEKPKSMSLQDTLDQLNINLSILIDTERWIGKYTSVSDTVSANSSRSEYKFYFPLRYLRINSDQPIKVQFNDPGNPVINISAGEFPYTLPDIRPGFVISSLYITTGAVDTNISILGMG